MPVNEPTLRKPFGIFLILAMLTLWAVIVASLADYLDGVPWSVLALYYTAAGIGWLWVLPIKPLLLWMETGRWR